MKKQNEKKENKFVAEQAVNFDKLPWNRKERNFALFGPTIGLTMYALAFINAMVKGQELDSSFEIISILILGLCTPLLYYAYKDYLWALIAIPVLGVAFGFYQYLKNGEIHWLGILGIIFFILPVKIELYRRKHGLSKLKDIKKDMIIGLSAGLFFPVFWMLAQAIRYMIK